MPVGIPYSIRRFTATAWWRANQWFKIAATHPATAVILTILTTLIGIAGSLSTDSLRCSWPLFQYWPSASCGAAAVAISNDLGLVVFWWSLLIFIILFLARELATAAMTAERERELLHTIRTMPPPDVLHAFRGMYANILEYVAAEVDARDRKVEDEIEAINCAIRYCLDNLTAFARNFQRTSNTSRFAANIMVFIDVKAIPKDQEAPILSALAPFVERPVFDGLKGVLYLRRELSTSTDDESNSFDADPKLKELALPVPLPSHTKDRRRRRYLPGAPTALEEGLCSIDDTRKLLHLHQTSDEYSEIPRSIFESLHHYFCEDDAGKLVRSFVSISLKESDGSNAPVIGILNIHSDLPNLFAEKWVLRSFVYLATPVVAQVAALLRRRITLARQGSSQPA